MVLQLLRESFLAKKKRTQPDDSLNLVLQGVRIYDPPSGTLQDNGALFDIFIANGRIESIEPAADKDKEKGRQPRSGRRVEGGGKVVMPGLCDAHVHVTACSADLPGLLSLPESLVAIRAEKVLEGMLLRGFTTVRDAGGADFGLAQAVEEGIILGPRLLFTGHALSQTGGHGDMRGRGEDFCACGTALRGIGRVCDGVPECRRAARDELRKGAHCIKVMASGGVASPTDRLTATQFSLEELAAIVDECEAAGSRFYVAAHAYTARAIKRAVQCGVRSIEHGNLLDDECAALMAERGCFLVPTLITYLALQERGIEAGMAPDLVAKVGDLVHAGLEALQIAERHGVTIVYGSDLLGELHPLQSREFELRSRVMGRRDVIQQATVNAGKLFHMDGDIGLVEAGFRADLLVLDGNPAEDLGPLIDAPHHLRMVIKEGLVAASDGSLPIYLIDGHAAGPAGVAGTAGEAQADRARAASTSSMHMEGSPHAAESDSNAKLKKTSSAS